MKYFCDKCKYETEKKYDFDRHNNTKKHAQNIKKEYKCEICDAVYDIRQSFYYHKKNCGQNNKDLQIQLLITKHELEIEKMKNQYEQQQNQLLKDMVKNSEKTKNTALKITSKTISALKYANENFKDAPSLLPIENYNIMNYDLDNEDDKKKLVEDILFYYRKKSLHTLFGKHIITEYKKNNISEQSMHTTDTSRMNYIIKTGELSKWKHDKNGVFVCNNVIEKLINFHIGILKWYNNMLLTELSNDPTRIQPSIQQKIENISYLLGDIESEQVLKDTNKYIAPFFNLDK
jgi:hypothetical protein